MLKLVLYTAIAANVFLVVTSTVSSRKCKKNEQYSHCINDGCDVKTCSQLGTTEPCEEISSCDCISGCICKDDYVRSENGTCIKKTDCPSCGGDPNAVSGCGVFCHKCSNYGQSNIACPEFCKINGCECRKGFIQDDVTKKCVRPTECTPTCKKHEVFSNCTNGGCEARNCTQLGKDVPCVELDPKNCIKGCVCAEGYLRDEGGTCIPKEKCPACGGDPNATSGCGVFCQQCSGNVPCPKICKKNGCACKRGYIYDANIKKCVLPKQCTPTCKTNEVFSNCTQSGCDPKNCSQLGKPVPCIDIDPKTCIKGCVCKKGFLRADNGTCIKTEHCPSCGGDPNAVSGCGVFCHKCSNYGQSNIACPKFCKINGCECRKGFIQDDVTKKCVRPTECTPTCKKHEVFSNCTNGGCEARNCTQLGKDVPCVELDPKNCIKGCVCAEGYLRDEGGTCIPKEKCPACGGDPNATSGCGVFCQQCSGNVPCPKICKKNGCACKRGYIYDANIQKCVLPKQCTPTCKTNEVFSNCTQSGCDPKNCSQLGKPVPCAKIDPKTCIKGCVCKKGFLRADNGTCIKTEHCPACGGDPNATSGCGVFCQQCSGNVPCPKICKKNGCACKRGYIYDANIQKCVLPKQCTPTCKTNEVFSNCTQSGCDPKNCSQLGKPVPCAKIDPKTCIKGCVCKKGFLRADNGTCIKTEHCPSCGGDPNAQSGCGGFCTRCSNYKKHPVCTLACDLNGCDCKKGFIFDDIIKKCVRPEQCTTSCPGPNEVYDPCDAPCPARRCDFDQTVAKCMRPPQVGDKECLVGCRCKDGFFRNHQNVCVRREQCQKKCQKNEEFDLCPDCDPRLCETRHKVYHCPLIPANTSDPKCKPTCRCKKGFFRDYKGKCVPAADCDKCEGPNEFFECGVACDNVCGSKIGRKNCNIINIKCNLKCYCKDGYARAANNTCIPAKDCPSPTCKKHEVFSNCTNEGCEARNCTQLGKDVPCVKIDPKNCIKGCVCAEGYLRDERDTCIPKEKCPACGDDPNATSGCGTFCNRCRGPIPCPRICKINGCDCKAGYVYDDNIQKCVLKEQCTPTCKPNEVFSNCTQSGCGPKNCSQLGKPVPCVKIDPKTCKKGCVCDEGLVRADNGTCIKKENCPSCGGDPNAQSGCGGFCTRCSNYKKHPVCTLACDLNGCDCKKGFIFDDIIKKCVRPEQCTTSCPGPNEVYDPCDAPCPARRCDFDPTVAKCMRPPQVGDKECLVGCRCKDGFFRNHQNVCVRREQCQKKCQKNEEFDLCPDCDPRLCETRHKVYHCPLIPANTSVPKCKPTCRCKKGFFRDHKGNCVPAADCDKCEGPNEFFECGVACDNVCGSKIGRKNCNIINIKCNPKCYCKDGYARAANNTCIPAKDCPSPTCKKHEVFSNCTNEGCEARNCTQLGKDVPCVKIDPKNCIKGCVCAKGYLRDEGGTCIPKNKCPACGDDPNATSGCGTFCNRCRGPTPCPRICKINGCDCKDGYIYDDNIQKCVLKEQCTPTCKPNEVFSNCTQSGCGPKNCSQLGKPVPCAKIDPKTCIKGCVCKKGLVRADNGTCIKTENCPSCGGDPNAQSGCGGFCTRCSNYKKHPVCTLACDLNGCDCKKGFIFDDIIKKCVRPEQCTTSCPGLNEVYDPCDAPCPARRCDFDQTVVKCGSPPHVGDKECLVGCRCKDGFFRNHQNVCVRREQCEKKCQKNEEFDLCPDCDPRLCETRDRVYDCRLVPADTPKPKCKPTCRCKKGFFRDHKGKCVPAAACAHKCKGPNEFFECGPVCDNVCGSKIGRKNCDIQNVKCNPKCYCKDGFARAANKTCVPVKDCPCQTCNTNEEYSSCANGQCRLKNCTQYGAPIPFCPKFDKTKCEGGCVCLKGYLRNAHGDCVLEEECPEATTSTEAPEYCDDSDQEE